MHQKNIHTLIHTTFKPKNTKTKPRTQNHKKNPKSQSFLNQKQTKTATTQPYINKRAQMRTQNAKAYEQSQTRTKKKQDKSTNSNQKQENESSKAKKDERKRTYGLKNE